MRKRTILTALGIIIAVIVVLIGLYKPFIMFHEYKRHGDSDYFYVELISKGKEITYKDNEDTKTLLKGSTELHIDFIGDKYEKEELHLVYKVKEGEKVILSGEYIGNPEGHIVDYYEEQLMILHGKCIVELEIDGVVEIISLENF